MRYLRPTRICNSHAPEVVALAHALDAYQKPDHEFMKAAFEFAKEKMTLEIHPNKIFPSQKIPAWQSSTTDTNPLLKTWYDALGYFLLEGEWEAYVDGQAHVGLTAKRQAASSIPITRFEEDSLDIWFHTCPEAIMRLEALPLGLAEGSWLLHKISPASMEHVNVSVQKQVAEGEKILQEAGSIEVYNKSVKKAGR